MLNVLNLAAVTKLGNRDGIARAARTARSANAVNVVFGFHRQAVVDDVGNGGHVQAACGHVGCHQNLNSSITERHQTAIAQALTQRAVQCHSAKTFLHQIVRQAVAFNLCAGKNNGLIDRRVAQQVVEQLALVRHVVSPMQCLGNGGMLFMRRVNLNPLRLAHHTRGQLHDARRKRGAEHHGLLALNRQLVDFGQVVGKAEVKHAVGLVNHQKLDLVEFDLHAALQVKQTAWRSNHQVGVLQFGNLQLVRNTAHHVGNAQAAAMAHQVNGVSTNLLGQLACGAQNQRTRRGSFEVAHVGRVFALWLFGGGFASGNCLRTQALEFGAFVTLSLLLLF